MTRSRNGTAVRTVWRSLAQSTWRRPVPASVSASVSASVRCLARLTEPRLQTAVSPSVVTSVISVHRFDRCTTSPPSAVWLHLALLASLNVIQPLPVCASVRIILP